jgi:hypothetical protein
LPCRQAKGEIIVRKSLVVVVLLGLTFPFLLVGCYQPGGPVPAQAHPSVPRSYTQQQVDARVVMEEDVISSPLPAEWGAPPECDTIHFLRFRLADGSTLNPSNPQVVNAANTDAMLVMLPGVLEGSNGFEYIGRQLVYQAKTRNNLNLEVWAVERRNNRLEDLSALNYLEDQLAGGRMTATEAARTAMDYYYMGKPVNGRTFQGWLTDRDLPFLSEFGVKLDTEDVFNVIQTMVPDRATRKKKVFVGGHSMGGIMTSLFAGWDLDGNPATTDDAGYNNCAGLFGLDTSVSQTKGMVDLFMKSLPQSLKDLLDPDVLSEGNYATLLNSLRTDPNSNRILPFPMINGESETLLEVIAMMAHAEPDSECTIVKEVPFSNSAQVLLRFLCSRDFGTYMDGTPQLKDFRLTNEAMLGMVFDDSFTPIGTIQNSMGFLGGGTVVKKDFPMSESISGIPIVGDLLSGFFGKGDYFIPNDAGPSAFQLGQGPLYHWINFDQVGTDANPDFKDTTGAVTYTTRTNEVSDAQDVARMIYKGPLSLTEQYFSTRCIVDQIAALASYGKKYGLNFIHGDKLDSLPKIEFIASQGMMGDSYVKEPAPPNTKRILCEGYNHMDVLSASANTPSYRENAVIKPLIGFLESSL